MEAVGVTGLVASFSTQASGCRWVRPPARIPPASRQEQTPVARASAITPPETREQCRARGARAGLRKAEGRPPRRPPNKRSGARTRRPAQKTVETLRGPGQRGGGPGGSPPQRPHNSRAERGRLAAPPRPAGPVRVRPRTWWFSFLPPAAAAGPPGPLVMFTYRERVSGLRRVHILPRQPHGRQAQAQPAREQSSGGLQPLAPITARAGGGRAAPPALAAAAAQARSHRPTRRPSSPFRAEAGVGGGRHSSRLPGLLRPRRRRRGRRFPPRLKRNACGAVLSGPFPRPKEPAGREAGQRRIRLARVHSSCCGSTMAEISFPNINTSKPEIVIVPKAVALKPPRPSKVVSAVLLVSHVALVLASGPLIHPGRDFSPGCAD